MVLLQKNKETQGDLEPDHSSVRPGNEMATTGESGERGNALSTHSGGDTAREMVRFQSECV